ncbi:aminotransferase-like domain-containing protein [Luteibacter sp. UNCMF366Tsu5.1]|uniref:aminotransferase-like domain-containing protein n=1 Tax=Luteibacter sp. UNCMF366Tsu5.1 TaxID=1502758 RepID=UPI000908D5BC|nr:PLP-dependent aminotransferase family protein [Luteibacter sp. UNCMF366Tsu5.1]SFW32865.1 DNA-binding transcriptional regulator, MocR family, contains an aminotransferase domain [Luteibacter sp. UNCMF366Tsu5.1]
MTPPYDLAVNLPLRTDVAAALGNAVAKTAIAVEDLGYPDPAGALAVRRSIAGWLRRVGGHGAVDPSRIALTLGARQALRLALLQARAPNGVLLVEDHTYQGVRALADAMGLRCVDVGMDGQGMRPDALALAAERNGATVVYVQPTLHNPTTATMPLSRRMDIAAVAEALGLTLIEGDVYGPLAWHGRDAVPPFAVLAPERTLHAGGVGKILGPGLRVGWLLHPDAPTCALTAVTMQREHDGIPTLWPSVVSRWMDDGTADALLETLALTMAERNATARRILGPELVTHASSLHAWLPFADPVAVEERLLAHGVRIAASRGFVSADRQPAGIRLALGAEEDPARLEKALRLVAQVL